MRKLISDHNARKFSGTSALASSSSTTGQAFRCVRGETLDLQFAPNIITDDAPDTVHCVGMGWMRTLLLGDIGNRLDIEDTERDVARLHRKQETSARKLDAKNRQIEVLRNEIAELKLATHALTRFLIERGTIDEQELEQFISDVDAEDGIIDGKIAVDLTTRRLRFAEKRTIHDGTFKKIDESK